MLRRLATLPIKDMFVPRYQVPSEPSVMGRGRVYAQVKLSLEMATLMLLFSSFCHKILLFFLPKSHIFAVKVTTKRSITKKDGNIKIKLPLPWYNFLLSRVGSFAWAPASCGSLLKTETLRIEHGGLNSSRRWVGIFRSDLSAYIAIFTI